MSAGAARRTSRPATASPIRACRASASATSAWPPSPRSRPDRPPLTRPRELRGRMDGKAYEPAHERAVDPDELQVAPDGALHLAREFRRIPGAHASHDRAPDVFAIARDPARRGIAQLLVDPGAHVGIGEELLAERA